MTNANNYNLDDKTLSHEEIKEIFAEYNSNISEERKTEIEAFAGTVCAKAEIYGIPVPRNREVYNIIRKKETGR